MNTEYLLYTDDNLVGRYTADEIAQVVADLTSSDGTATVHFVRINSVRINKED